MPASRPACVFVALYAATPIAARPAQPKALAASQLRSEGQQWAPTASRSITMASTQLEKSPSASYLIAVVRTPWPHWRWPCSHAFR